MADETTPAQNQSDGAQGQKPAAPTSFSLLAKEEFGNEFYGEVKENTTPAVAEDTKPVTEPTGSGDTDGGGRETETDPKEATAAGEEDKPAGDEPSDEVTISTAQELVEHLEADPAWFNSLKVNVKVHDKDSQVPLSELVSNYQQNQAADERLAQAKTKSEQAQQEYAQRNAALDQQFAVAANMIEQVETLINADMAAINWDELKRTDPAMWSAKQVEFRQRQDQVLQMKHGIGRQFMQAQEMRQQDSQAKLAERLTTENQLLLEAMPKVSPDWGDQTKLPQARTRLADYLLTQGFTKEDVMGAADHRLLLTAEKARLWDESQGKVQLAKKRVQLVPKIVKPGAKTDAQTVNLGKVKAARAKLAAARDGGGDQIAAAAELLRLKRG